MYEGNSKLTLIEKQAPWGIYVWYTNDNKVLGSDGNILNIPAREFDLAAINKITKAAAHYGYTEGRAVYWPGTRRVSEMEYSEQLDRMKEGYIPSETDIGAWSDALKGLQANGEG